MTDGLSVLTLWTAQLRDKFDRSFAEPGRLGTATTEHLLSVRVRDDLFAIRLSEIVGLHADKKITRVAGGDPALLGIAGFRGSIQAVYGLATVLGRSTDNLPRWLVIAAGASVALAFDAFEGYLRVASERIRPRDANATDQPYARSFVPVHESVWPILHLPTVVDGIKTHRTAACQQGILEDV
jgi:chemotaxis signal transduction protein